jgi:hypothetical protein
MDGENGQITHPAMLTIRVGGARLGSLRQKYDKSEFATHTLLLATEMLADLRTNRYVQDDRHGGMSPGCPSSRLIHRPGCHAIQRRATLGQ